MNPGNELDQLLGEISIRRIIRANGNLETVWEINGGMTYEESITVLEMTKLKLHYLMMREDED